MVATVTEVSEHDEQLVAFHLADEIYGVDIFDINEIIRLREITHIPRTTPDVRAFDVRTRRMARLYRGGLGVGKT